MASRHNSSSSFLCASDASVENDDGNLKYNPRSTTSPPPPWCRLIHSKARATTITLTLVLALLLVLALMLGVHGASASQTLPVRVFPTLPGQEDTTPTPSQNRAREGVSQSPGRLQEFGAEPPFAVLPPDPPSQVSPPAVWDRGLLSLGPAKSAARALGEVGAVTPRRHLEGHQIGVSQGQQSIKGRGTRHNHLPCSSRTRFAAWLAAEMGPVPGPGRGR